MKKEPDNIQAPDAAEFWPAAEKMLDQHYQSKRRKKRTLIFIFASVGLIFSAFLFFENITIKKNEGPITSDSGQIKSSTVSENNTKEVSVETNLKIKQDLENVKNLNKFAREQKAITLNEKKNVTSELTKKETSATLSVSKDVLTYKKSAPEKSASYSKGKQTAKKTVEKLGENLPEENSWHLNDGNRNIEPSLSLSESATGLNQDEANENIRLALMNRNLSKQISVPGYEPDLIANVPHSRSEATRSNTKRGIAVAFYSGLYNVSKSVEADKPSLLLERRDQEEKNLIVPVYGINLSLIKNNLSASIGIEYTSLGEKTAYGSYSLQTKYTNSGDWTTFNRTVIDTDTAYVSGLQWFLQTQVNKLDSTYINRTDTSIVNTFDPELSAKNGKTKFYYVEIPIMFRYQIPLKRFAFGITAGLSPAWLLTEKGLYLKDDQSGLESVSTSKPLKKFILNGRAGIDISYSINPRLNFFISPQIKMNLKTISNSDQDIRQKYTALGINLGIVYGIN